MIIAIKHLNLVLDVGFSRKVIEFEKKHSMKSSLKSSLKVPGFCFVWAGNIFNFIISRKF